MNYEFINFVKNAGTIITTGSYLEFRQKFHRKGRPVQFWFCDYMQTEEEKQGRFIKIHLGNDRYRKISEKRIIFKEELAFWNDYCKGISAPDTKWIKVDDTWYCNKKGQLFGVF